MEQLKALEKEQDRLRDSLRVISMSVAANAMAHEQKQAEQRRARGLVGGRREAACAKYSATATELLQALARAVGSAKARRRRVGINGQGAAAGASSHSSPTRPSARVMHLPQQPLPPQPQQCFRAGGGGGYIHNPDAWRFDPFVAPLPLTVPLPPAVLDAAALAVTDPLLAADQQQSNGQADFDEHVKQVGSSLPLPAEYLPGPPPPPAMLPQRGDAIRGVALDVLNPFDAAARTVHALGGGGGTGEMWSISRQESQMKDAVLPPGMLSDAMPAANGAGAGGGEEEAVLGRLEGLLGLGPQLLKTPTLLAEARVRVGVVLFLCLELWTIFKDGMS